MKIERSTTYTISYEDDGYIYVSAEDWRDQVKYIADAIAIIAAHELQNPQIRQSIYDALAAVTV